MQKTVMMEIFKKLNEEQPTLLFTPTSGEFDGLKYGYYGIPNSFVGTVMVKFDKDTENQDVPMIQFKIKSVNALFPVPFDKRFVDEARKDKIPFGVAYNFLKKNNKRDRGLARDAVQYMWDDLNFDGVASLSEQQFLRALSNAKNDNNKLNHMTKTQCVDMINVLEKEKPTLYFTPYFTPDDDAYNEAWLKGVAFGFYEIPDSSFGPIMFNFGCDWMVGYDMYLDEAFQIKIKDKGIIVTAVYDTKPLGHLFWTTHEFIRDAKIQASGLSLEEIRKKWNRFSYKYDKPVVEKQVPRLDLSHLVDTENHL